MAFSICVSVKAGMMPGAALPTEAMMGTTKKTTRPRRPARRYCAICGDELRYDEEKILYLDCAWWKEQDATEKKDTEAHF